MTVAIIGAGVMGETLLSGLIRAGRSVDDLVVGEKRTERAAELVERYGVSVLTNAEATAKADTVTLVVKPQDMADVLAEIAPHVRPGQLVVSLAGTLLHREVEGQALGVAPDRGELLLLVGDQVDAAAQHLERLGVDHRGGAGPVVADEHHAAPATCVRR